MNPVLLIAQPSMSGAKVQWSMCQGTVCGNSPSTFPTVTLDPKSGQHVFIVHIKDPAGVGAVFAEDALWMQSSHGSPPQKGLNSSGQVGSFTRLDDSTIFFTDLNNNQGDLTLGYRLNFTGPGTTTSSIDPDIKNGGGSTKSLYGISASAALAIGLAVGAALVFAFFRLRAR